MRLKARKIMVIDDLANRPHDCDVLLDQNFHPNASTRYESLIPLTASRFLGPQFALLRQEFHEAKKTMRRRTGEINRVLICMGGSDPDNVTGEVVEALLDERFSHLEMQVVVGQSNPHLQSIEAQIEGRGNFHVLTDVQNMAQLMAESDFAIGGGGTMLWERAYLALRSVVIPLAENQRAAALEAMRACFVEWVVQPGGMTMVLSSSLIPFIARGSNRSDSNGPNQLAQNQIGTIAITDKLLNLGKNRTLSVLGVL
jgi:UDP-2,4-diacetamido-2,4,6-trideoxy-beta-L-altropyranose hydrolase